MRRPPQLALDPASPVPLYHQIAEHIRARILAGELAAGEALHPLRVAAEQWAVNLHTVRHAYAALAREGLLEISRGALGTRVAGKASALKKSSSGAAGGAGERELTAFVRRVTREAESRFGATPRELAAAIRTQATRAARNRTPIVYVTECSLHQCETHARELAERYHVRTEPWPLDFGELPAGPVIATYFHYNDIRRRWPLRLQDVRFITIRPRAELRAQLAGRAGVVYVCERDSETAEAVIGDVYALLGDTRMRLVPVVTKSPAEPLRSRSTAPVLYPPRVWARLDRRSRADARAIEIVYELDAGELHAFALESEWNARATSAAS